MSNKFHFVIRIFLISIYYSLPFFSIAKAKDTFLPILFHKLNLQK